MPSNFLKDDPFSGAIDLDEEYVTDAWLVDQFVGNQLFSWGQNSYGQLGLGDTTYRSSPIQVGAATNWKQVSSALPGLTSLAVKKDGTLWAWGNNLSGQLGLGDRNHRSSPTQVGSLTNWKQVTGGSVRSLAIKTDGTLWAWGDSGGTGTTTSSPVQVGALTDWKQVVAVYNTYVAVKTDGTLWSWGGNEYGQLGLGDITFRSSPVQVGTLNNWAQVSVGEYHVVAVKTNGTLWAWGLNDSGQLGLGDTTRRSSPVQVGSLTNWKQASAGWGFNIVNQGPGGHSVAVKTDGTLWAWGTGGFGQLGLGDVFSRSSPVQVGALTTWKRVDCGFANTHAIKTDGTLWQFGVIDNPNIAIYVSSPTQVGSLTSWKQISSGGDAGIQSTLGVTYNDIT